MPKITVNGKEVTLPEGAKVIEGFRASGEEICHYCWHPGLSTAGVCRLCMVEIEGNPRMQIACNTEAQEGMVVTNQSDKVKEAARFGLDFHLINHPLDCPICDQAGECGLQDQYMKFGKYTPEMAERKVSKHKVVDLGPTVVLDSERCILCSRCVRFTAEVSKTDELGIFNRGDRAEIGVVEGRRLDNDYSLNVVDICPVGALTDKDFRFKQRVWYLEHAPSLCTGCSTGCSINVYYNEEGAFRVKPIENQEVNGFWMCDRGRSIYKHLNKGERLLQAEIKKADGIESVAAGEAVKRLKETLDSVDSEKVAVVVTAQYTSEEYAAFFKYVKETLKTQQVYYWINHRESFDDFDGLLMRGDQNPNTKGLLDAMVESGFNLSWDDLKQKVHAGKIDTILIVGPENQAAYPDIIDRVHELAAVPRMVWFSSNPVKELLESQSETWQIPMKTFFEKEGTYVNFKGVEQKVKRGSTMVVGALSLVDISTLLSGGEVTVN
ncbi:MAG: (2Fe-2S)-binding protein, partial [Bdellovibrionales bacterium]|nr:(2Fe-2S)-binding protein [Bdellovibrionales bacterium]